MGGPREPSFNHSYTITRILAIWKPHECSSNPLCALLLRKRQSTRTLQRPMDLVEKVDFSRRDSPYERIYYDDWSIPVATTKSASCKIKDDEIVPGVYISSANNSSIPPAITKIFYRLITN